MPKSTSELVVERFYAALDEEVETSLTAEQKRGIEQALVRANLASRHRIDFRHSFPFLHRRYFVVFLLVGICAKSRARAPCSGASSRPC